MRVSTYLKNFNFMNAFKITGYVLPIGVYFVVKTMHWGAKHKEE
jgi:hypothetical protein